MYKIEIDISAWGGDEKVTIETSDFDKIEIIQEFIEFQQEHGWAVDYIALSECDDESSEEEGEDQEKESEITTYVITEIKD